MPTVVILREALRLKDQSKTEHSMLSAEKYKITLRSYRRQIASLTALVLLRPAIFLSTSESWIEQFFTHVSIQYKFILNKTLLSSKIYEMLKSGALTQGVLFVAAMARLFRTLDSIILFAEKP
ncbi:MAG: hypothetical protein HQK85_05040 [Nitrospinae bacterium]|nr:hypothetical protein [Nitrospinota bacterium]